MDIAEQLTSPSLRCVETQYPTSRNMKDLGLQAVRSVSREWTNEKHSLYLNSMEALFVRQLHNHEYDRLGPRRENMQFKVFQSGCWKEINFERGQAKMNNSDGPHVLMENQWVRHFRNTGEGQEPTLPNLQDGAQSSESMFPGRPKLELSGSVDRNKEAYGASTCSKKLHVGYSHHRDHDYFSSNTEVSDQNFVDDDNEEKHTRNHYRAKKKKTSATTDILNIDQVVPLRIFPTTVDDEASRTSLSENMEKTACKK